MMPSGDIIARRNPEGKSAHQCRVFRIKYTEIPRPPAAVLGTIANAILHSMILGKCEIPVNRMCLHTRDMGSFSTPKNSR